MQSPDELFSGAERALTMGYEVANLINSSQLIIEEQRRHLMLNVARLNERIALTGRHAVDCYARGQATDFDTAIEILRRHVGLAVLSHTAIKARLAGGKQHA